MLQRFQPTCAPTSARRSYGAPAWQLLPELRRQPGDHVITSKRTYDAFQVGAGGR